MSSTSTPNEGLIDIGGISPNAKSDPAAEPTAIISGAQADSKSNYDRGYEAGYARATADILKTIKEHYGE